MGGVTAAHVIMLGCMSEEQRVNVVLSTRLSLIDGQLKSWSPFTLIMPCFSLSKFVAEGSNSKKAFCFPFSPDSNGMWSFLNMSQCSMFLLTSII